MQIGFFSLFMYNVFYFFIINEGLIMNIANNVTELVGNTPIVKLSKISKNLYAKCEFANPTSSVKDRPAVNLIKKALENGSINSESTLIEPTSGNTGIALASVCASLGLRLILTMPESMSLERRKLLKFLGAEIVLTPKEKGMAGAVNRADELHKEISNSIVVGQFENEANPDMHKKTTAVEIYEQMDSKVDIFVAAVGTGGTLTGVGEFLKEQNENISVIAVEPKNSDILSGGKPAPHKIQGIGAGFVPKILNTKVYDKVFTVTDDEAIEMAKEIAKKEGLLIGISAGANVAVAKKIAEANPDKNVVTILCDTAERYLSTDLFAEIEV